MLWSDFVPEVVCCGNGFKFLRQTLAQTLYEQLNCLCLRKQNVCVSCLTTVSLFSCVQQRMNTAHKCPTFSLKPITA